MMVCLLKKTKQKKQRKPLYRKIRSVANSIHVVILHTDKGPKTWGDFPNWNLLLARGDQLGTTHDY
jgi:hypothetical protein